MVCQLVKLEFNHNLIWFAGTEVSEETSDPNRRVYTRVAFRVNTSQLTHPYPPAAPPPLETGLLCACKFLLLPEYFDFTSLKTVYVFKVIWWQPEKGATV